jgi:replicative DNA helicase
MIPQKERLQREEYLSKPLPSNTEAERVTLGAIIVDNVLITQAIELLNVEDFYSPLYRQVFQAMINLFDRSETIDPILIGNEISKTGSLESIGGIATITNLTYGLPHFSDIEDYAKLIKAKAIARNLIKVCNQTTNLALDEETDIIEILESAEQSIFELRPNDAKKGFVRAGEIVKGALIKVMEIAKHARDENTLLGISTGFKELNRKLSGLMKSDLIIVGGRPSSGKSAFCIDLALNATDDDTEAVVAVFSLEVSKESNALRMIAQRAVIDSQRLKVGFLVPNEVAKVNDAAQEIDAKRIFIDDEPGLSALEIRAKARRIAVEQKRIDLIIVDHLDLVRPADSKKDKRLQLSEITKSLKATAKLLNVPVVVLTPLSRECEKRNPPKPMLSDLAESGAIEYDADVVLLIYRESYYPRLKTSSNAGTAEIIVAKNRNNPTGSVNLAWVGYATTFQNLDEN